MSQRVAWAMAPAEMSRHGGGVTERRHLAIASSDSASQPPSPSSARVKQSCSKPVAASAVVRTSSELIGVHLAKRPPVGSSGAAATGARAPTLAPSELNSRIGKQKLSQRATASMACLARGVPRRLATSTQTAPVQGTVPTLRQLLTERW